MDVVTLQNIVPFQVNAGISARMGKRFLNVLDSMRTISLRKGDGIDEKILRRMWKEC